MHLVSPYLSLAGEVFKDTPSVLKLNYPSFRSQHIPLCGLVCLEVGGRSKCSCSVSMPAAPAASFASSYSREMDG